jgi:glycine cleavage system aminomethyltransferase T
VALALLDGGSARIGAHVKVCHLGRVLDAEVVRTPFVDPAGKRVHG